jgi:hypothetical protein
MEFNTKYTRWGMLAAIFLLLPATARAEPQALGLVATRDATPLQCEAGVCAGFFSTFCLEEDRMAPDSRAAYRPTEDSEITLVVETADGRAIRLPGRDYLTFHTRLDFTSIVARVAEARLAAFAPVRVGVEIGALVSLVPVTRAGDTDIHEPGQLALATGPYRRAGRNYFDNGGETAETVSMVTRMINVMPERGRLARTRRAVALRDTLAGAEGRAARTGARARFRSIVQGCEAMLDATAERFNMRACLVYRHEVIQTRTNRIFWKALGGV